MKASAKTLGRLPGSRFRSCRPSPMLTGAGLCCLKPQGRGTLGSGPKSEEQN